MLDFRYFVLIWQQSPKKTNSEDELQDLFILAELWIVWIIIRMPEWVSRNWNVKFPEFPTQHNNKILELGLNFPSLKFNIHTQWPSQHSTGSGNETSHNVPDLSLTSVDTILLFQIHFSYYSIYNRKIE